MALFLLSFMTALSFVELQETLVILFLQTIQVPLNSSTPIWCIRHSSQFCIICKLAEDALYLSVWVINEDSIGTNNPWEPLVTVLQLAFVLPTTTHWGCQLIHFFYYLLCVVLLLLFCVLVKM